MAKIGAGAPVSLMELMAATMPGESFKLCPMRRARNSLISHVAWPSITAMRALAPSSLLRPCLMKRERL